MSGTVAWGNIIRLACNANEAEDMISPSGAPSVAILLGKGSIVQFLVSQGTSHKVLCLNTYYTAHM